MIRTFAFTVLAFLVIALFTLALGSLSRPVPIYEAEAESTVSMIRVLPAPNSSADAFALYFVSSSGKEDVLIGKEHATPHPIASVTKLMTALLAKERTAGEPVTLTASVLTGKGRSGLYRAGDTLSQESALKALLVASHNDVAEAVVEQEGGAGRFVLEMNARARALGLSHTFFTNATGLDPDSAEQAENRSSPEDLYRLMRRIREFDEALLALSRLTVAELTAPDGRLVASVETTNELLTDPSLPFPILGGKTGETPRAKQNLVLVLSAPCGGTLYAVVLGSDDRVRDMKELLSYVTRAYRFSCPAPSRGAQ